MYPLRFWKFGLIKNWFKNRDVYFEQLLVVDYKEIIVEEKILLAKLIDDEVSCQNSKYSTLYFIC